MMCLEDQLENLEFLLERARCAGDQEAIHVLTKQRDYTVAQIAVTRTPLL
jgi:hypothetical protein